MTEMTDDEVDAYFKAEQERLEYEQEEQPAENAKASVQGSAELPRYSWKKGYFVKNDGKTYL